MSIGRLILHEIAHRKISFLLGVLAVMFAVATLVAAQAITQGDALETSRLLAAKEAQGETALTEKREAVATAGAELEDAMRKHMLGLGFNVLILPEDQNLSELHLSGGLSATMPESYVDKLANSDIVTVNHLLPSVTRRITWSEHERDVILVGTRGEVPIMHRALKKPLLEAVAPGKIVVGYDIHQDLGLSEGDAVTLMGKEFTVSSLHPQRGNDDDVTVWIDLEQAQQMLGLENLIHAILALECECAGDRISVVREEIAGILPGTQVVERYSAALARAEARSKAKDSAEAALAAEEQSAKGMLEREAAGRREHETQRLAMAGLIVPFAMIASIALIALLAYANARARQPEIGILRAIGLTSGQIMAAFLGKAVLIGLLGGILGVLLGAAVVMNIPGAMSRAPEINPQIWSAVASSRPMVTTFLLAPIAATLLAGLASWVPALLAARQDPALILQGE
jgi:putative ABC transport system permease protein